MTSIRKVGVLGAGVMGSQIAAHCVNAGCDVLLLDVIPDWKFNPEELKDINNRNHLALKGLKMAQSLKPAPFALKTFSELIEIGSFSDSRDKLQDVEWSDDLEKLKDVDWIIEAVLENVDIKHKLFRQVADIVRPCTIISSNTSGIPLDTLAKALPNELKQNFLGTHFFNPPRYLALIEIIPTAQTSKETIANISDFCDKKLGKSVVIAKDSPGFIANRVALPSVMNIIQTMLEDEYTIEDVDAMTGKAIGWPKSATFRTLDVVGLNIVNDVVNFLHDALPYDIYKDILVMPEFVCQMIENGWLGQKSGKGFYQKRIKQDGSREILAIDPKTLEHHPKQKARFTSIEQGKNIPNIAERIAFLVNSKDRAGTFLQKTLLFVIAHAAECLYEIADDIVSVDTAMKNGFLWELGPFEIWDALGVEKVATMLDKSGQTIPTIVEDVLKTDHQSFYHRDSGKTLLFDFKEKNHRPVDIPKGIIILKDLKETDHVIAENKEASLIDIGDEVCCLEFHSKMNAIGPGTISMMKTAIKQVTENDAYKGLVIANQGDHFSVGANLDLVKEAILNDELDEVDLMIKVFQDANMGFKHMPKPVVAAPFGYTFGGGCEVCLHADMVCAAHETYMGLVEVGAGVIPAAGGTKEMLIRNLEAIPEAERGDPEVDALPFIQRALKTVGMAKVATSAFEAKKLGYLRDSDVIVMNKNRLIEQAKHQVLALSRNYQPPRPQKITLYGQRIYSALNLGIHLLKKGGYMSEYDEVVTGTLAEIFTGGDLSEPTQVSEQYMLNAERKAFLYLCSQKKTQERIAHILKTGKPLRN